MYVFFGIISILSIYTRYLYGYLHLNKKEKNINLSNIFDKLNFIDTVNLIKEDLATYLIKTFKKMMVILNLLIVFFTPIYSWMKNIMVSLFEKLEIQRYFFYIFFMIISTH
jgi:hypothetical protein